MGPEPGPYAGKLRHATAWAGKQHNPVGVTHGVGWSIENRRNGGWHFGSPGGTRTPDKAVNSRLLYQLSYRGMVLTEKMMVTSKGNRRHFEIG